MISFKRLPEVSNDYNAWRRYNQLNVPPVSDEPRQLRQYQLACTLEYNNT